MRVLKVQPLSQKSSSPLDFDIAIQETILSALAGFDRKLRLEIENLDGMILQ